MDFMQFFRPANQGQQPQQQPQQGQQQQQQEDPNIASTMPPGSGQQQGNQQNQQSAMNNQAPGSQGQSNNQQQSSPQANPLESFKDLWNNPATKDQQNGQFQTLNADPAKIHEFVSSKVDFSKQINPQLAQKALAGDVNALGELLNSVGRSVLATSIQASSHLVDKQSSSAVDFMKNSLPNQFKQFSARENLQAENPQFANPAVKPMLDAVQQQLAARFPEASAAELQQYAKKYLSGVVEILGGKMGQSSGEQETLDENQAFTKSLQQKNKEINDFDWDNWAIAQRPS